MEYIKKQWVRVIISLLSGGVIAELCFVSFDKDPYNQKPLTVKLLILGIAVIVYFVLTEFVNDGK
jgi:hypothetical protein